MKIPSKMCFDVFLELIHRILYDFPYDCQYLRFQILTPFQWMWKDNFQQRALELSKAVSRCCKCVLRLWWYYRFICPLLSGCFQMQHLCANITYNNMPLYFPYKKYFTFSPRNFFDELNTCYHCFFWTM